MILMIDALQSASMRIRYAHARRTRAVRHDFDPVR